MRTYQPPLVSLSGGCFSLEFTIVSLKNLFNEVPCIAGDRRYLLVQARGHPNGRALQRVDYKYAFNPPRALYLG